ncbi:hypothetical protein JAAARDRAFT_141256 [Jaapia argillacea MUCL 33604]|uniref:Potassium transport protein n=1 Tax=Jaapia argillacea MUCL 33604 TaxID=933084 RepID=A0A067P7X1_9AGAM|nr:hypothetical protein JAAARDRAFT_141256 [Jaapia argillacea MUCL 33604]
MQSQRDARAIKQSGVLGYLKSHLNFFRVHILFYTFTPLMFSGILYASNGRYPMTYIDALFNSVSAMTVCGLATVDLSGLTGWQQALLFIQMCLGSPVSSLHTWSYLSFHRYFFAKTFEHMIHQEVARRVHKDVDVEATAIPWHGRLSNLFRRRKRAGARDKINGENLESPRKKERRRGSIIGRLRTDMIQRMDETPKLVNPSGWISEGHAESTKRRTRSSAYEMQSTGDQELPALQRTLSPESESGAVIETSGDGEISTADQESASQHRSYLTVTTVPVQLDVGNAASAGNASTYPRSHTIEFAPTPPRQTDGRRPHRGSTVGELPRRRRPSLEPIISDDGTTRQFSTPLNRTNTVHSQLSVDARRKHQGFGGFPTPIELASSWFGALFPNAQRRFQRTVTMPLTTSIASRRGDAGAPRGAKAVSYVSFDAIVGRNSEFYELTNEQLEELGGVEYRALNALLWLVAGYHIGVQLISFIVIAPYMSESRWANDFTPPNLHRTVPPPWFSLFQVVSSYTNTGMSLVDQSMVPFQTAYPMIIFMVFLILAGNTAFVSPPIILRDIWTISKLVPTRARLSETLQFLLDHPRRCFIYLFPSHQTWFLLTVLVMLNGTDWFSFLVLDLGTPDVMALPVGTRVIDGLLQAVAVRSSGFATVSLAGLAPAVRVLYVIMMYISVCNVRSTNVYEEQSLGIFPDEDKHDEATISVNGPRVVVWSRYLAWHARKQLAFDMWWLGLALVLVCIIERPNLDDVAKQSWFNIFTIIFELVSAYGTVGLSLGIPTENYSFSGALRPLSKLIVCLVMLRGRHRGLPVAIDRAVMLPVEFDKPDDEDAVDEADLEEDQNRSSRENNYAEHTTPHKEPPLFHPHQRM